MAYEDDEAFIAVAKRGEFDKGLSALLSEQEALSAKQRAEREQLRQDKESYLRVKIRDLLYAMRALDVDCIKDGNTTILDATETNIGDLIFGYVPSGL